MERRGRRSQDAAQTATDLHTLLGRAHIPGPYVLAGHSFGVNEFREGAMATQQAASLADFASKPLIVITAGRGHDAEWMLAQDKLATLSTNSRHRVVADTTHESLLLDVTRAAVSHAIRDVVTAVRTSRPLPSP